VGLYGAVGTAVADGWSHLPIHLGPMLVFGFGHWFIKRLGAAGKVDGTNPVSEVIGGQRGSSMPAASRRFRRAQARPDVRRALPECRLSGRLCLGQFGGWNDSALSYAANPFWGPAKGFDLGVEYRRGQRELVNGSKGQLDRLEFASKYSF